MPLLVLILAALASPGQTTAPRDTVAAARELYNQGDYDAAIEAATIAGRRPDQADAAALVLARARLERFREQQQPVDLQEGRTALQLVDPSKLPARDRREFIVGLAELQFFDGRFGPAAELFNSVLEPIDREQTADGHERLLDWWATALDRRAREDPVRQSAYADILERMEGELRAHPESAVAAYWIVAAAHGAGDPARAWDAAVAAWVRASLSGDRADRLRADLAHFVEDVLIPELGRAAPGRPAHDADQLRQQWEAITGGWTPPG